MGPDLLITLTLSYATPENRQFEGEIMDLADDYAESLIHPFMEDNGRISIQLAFKNDQYLMKFKSKAVDIATYYKIYVNFTI